jgi:hypothetical protein
MPDVTRAIAPPVPSLPPPSGDFSYVARMLFPDDMARDFGEVD